MAKIKAWIDGVIVEIEDDRPPVVVEPTPPATPLAKSWTPLEFKELFTLEERINLREIAKTDPLFEDWLDMLNASTLVKADDARTINGLNYLVQKGKLTAERRNSILND